MFTSTLVLVLNMFSFVVTRINNFGCSVLSKQYPQSSSSDVIVRANVVSSDVHENIVSPGVESDGLIFTAISSYMMSHLWKWQLPSEIASRKMTSPFVS